MSTLCQVAFVLNIAAVILLSGVVREFSPPANQWLWAPGFVLLGLCSANIIIAIALAVLRTNLSPEYETFLRFLTWGAPMGGLLYALIMFGRVIPSSVLPS